MPNADPDQSTLNWPRRVGSGLWTGWKLTGLALIPDIRIPSIAKAFAGTERPALSFGGIRAERSTMVSPETRYARSGDVRVAYQVVGSRNSPDLELLLRSRRGALGCLPLGMCIRSYCERKREEVGELHKCQVSELL